MAASSSLPYGQTEMISHPKKPHQPGSPADPLPDEVLQAQIWAEFFGSMRTIEVPDDFMADRPMNRIPRD